MNKRTGIIAGVIAVAVCGYVLWQCMTPVEIVAVHDGDVLLVRHFPYLKSRQIAWWEANKDMIQAKHRLPHKKPNGDYQFYIQDVGDGYRIDNKREEDWNLLCFDDMTVEAKCIEKSPLMTIGSSQNTGLFYW